MTNETNERENVVTRESREHNAYVMPEDAKIIAQQPARFSEHASPHPLASNAIVSTVNEVLLSNGDTVFMCVHPNSNGACTYMAKSIRSVTAHQRAHGAQTLLNKSAIELAELKAKKDQQRANRSNGTKAGYERRKQLIIGALEKPIEDAITKLQIAKNNLTEAQKTYDEALIVFISVARSIEKKTSSATPPISEELRLKAEKWDKYIEFQKLINN